MSRREAQILKHLAAHRELCDEAKAVALRFATATGYRGPASDEDPVFSETSIIFHWHGNGDPHDFSMPINWLYRDDMALVIDKARAYRTSHGMAVPNERTTDD